VLASQNNNYNWGTYIVKTPQTNDGLLIIISIVGMMDLGNPRIFVTYGKDRFGPSSYIH
jgi:hypothetical protein